MATYNGFVAASSLNGSTVSQTLGSTGVQNVNVQVNFPHKFFSHGQFAVNVAGVSGVVGIQIIGAVGGATFVIAGRTNITGSGGFPVPLLNYVGTSGSVQNAGIPRPAFVSFQAGATGSIGITASVFFCGRY